MRGMDLDAPPAGRAPPRPAGGHGRRRQGAQAEESDVTTVLKKMALAHSQMLRALAASVWCTYLGDAAWQLVAAALTAARRYLARVQEEGAGHRCGPPRLRNYQAFSKSLLTLVSDSVAVQDLAGSLAAMQRLTIEETAATVLCNKVNEAHPKEGRPPRAKVVVCYTHLRELHVEAVASPELMWMFF